MTLVRAKKHLGQHFLWRFDMLVAPWTIKVDRVHRLPRISVKAAYGGPADRLAYGEIEDFVASRVEKPTHSNEQKKLFSYYQDVRNLRDAQQISEAKLTELFHRFLENTPTEWLLFLEISEMALKAGVNSKKYEAHLSTLNPIDLISEGLKLAHAKY